MEKKLKSGMAVSLLILFVISPFVSWGQSEKEVVKKYLQKLPNFQISHTIQKYRMTAVYTNLDLYGNFTGKIKITGDYTQGLENGFVRWTNVFISNSNNFSESFSPGTKQTYMEDFNYIPSPKMLDAESFKSFPAGTDAVIARNLVWDMMAIEQFAWDFTDSLRLNKTYRIPQITGTFNMANIGTYAHNEVQVCWTGISAIHNELCAVIEYRALDNKIELSMTGFKTKGTEQYWGTTWVSYKAKSIEAAVMYSGTIQEMDIQGMKDKLLVKTIRDIRVEKLP